MQPVALMPSTSVKLSVGLALALVSTVLVNLAYVREHDAVGGMPALSLGTPLVSLRRLLGDRDWLAGFGMESTGFALYVVALALAPLALVQSVGAGGIGVLAFASARLAHRRMTRRETIGAAVSVLGLVLLSISLINGGSGGGSGSLVEITVWLAGTVAAAVLVLTIGRRFVGSGVADGIAGGLLFSCGDISTKLATQGGTRVAFALVAILGYVLGTSLLQIGYQRAAALTVAGVATLLTTALPIAAGPVLLNETVPGGALGVLRILAFATVTAGAFLLARRRSGSSRPPTAPVP
jgi:hypothetical protein